MSTKNILRLLSMSLGAIALYMLYLAGGWMLPVAIFIFGWSMNLDQTARGKTKL